MRTCTYRTPLVLRKLFVFFFLAVLPLSALAGYKTTYEIPVVVNVIGDVSDDDIDEAIETANEILEQAGIRLSEVHTNRPFNIGNNTTTVTETEACGDGVEKGNAELKRYCDGADKGIKLYFVDGKLLDPKTTGYTPNGTNVGYVKKDTDTDGMGSDIAHEVAHMLGVDEDYASKTHPEYASNLMGYGGGSDIRPDQARRMRAKARLMGKKVKKAPPAQPGPNIGVQPNPGRQVVTPSGFNHFDPNSILYDPPPSPADVNLLAELTGCVNITNTHGGHNPDPDEEDGDSTLKFEIYTDGLLQHNNETMPWSLQDIRYTISLFAPAGGNTAEIVIEIMDLGVEFIADGRWTDSVETTPLDADDVQMRVLNRCTLNNEPEEGGLSSPQSHALSINIPEPLVLRAGLFAEEMEVMITTHALIDGPSYAGMVSESDIAIMAAPQLTPDLSETILLNNNGSDFILYGNGLTPNEEFEVRIDAVPAGLIMTGPEGEFEYPLPSGISGDGVLLPDSLHRIALIEQPLAPLPAGQAPYWTTFEMVTGELIEGDVNTDGTVNLLDLAAVAENWLIGQAYD